LYERLRRLDDFGAADNGDFESGGELRDLGERR
jgi:hypothetical protein